MAEGRGRERHDPLRDEALRLISGVKDFMGGKASSNAVLQLHAFLSADAHDLAAAGLRAGTVHSLGVKNGGWRRHVAFEEGALHVLTDVVSEVGEAAPAAAAARCLAMLAASNSKVRDAAFAIGTVRLLIKMGSSSTKAPDWSDAQAAAAEAIWSLIYSSKDNHAEAVRR